MDKAAEKIWTHAVYLVVDVASHEEKEAALIKVGDARLTGSDFIMELAPGLSISGKIVLRLREEHPI